MGVFLFFRYTRAGEDGNRRHQVGGQKRQSTGREDWKLGGASGGVYGYLMQKKLTGIYKGNPI